MIDNTMQQIGHRAKQAKEILAQSTDKQRKQALLAMAEVINNNVDLLLEENAKDLSAGTHSGLSDAMMDRLRLTPLRIQDMAAGLTALAQWPDPLGLVLEDRVLASGVHLQKRTVPLGVIGVVYESRPNVTADCAGLCVRAGNACILRGGKEAIHTNGCLARLLRGALVGSGLPADCVILIEDVSRDSTEQLIKLQGFVDLLIPRGGRGLIDYVRNHARVPVLQTGEGVCHVYVDADADLNMAADIIHNAKTSRPSVCNAVECLLVHEQVADKALPIIANRLGDIVQIRGDEAVCRLLPTALPALEEDWGHEFLNLTLAVRVVGNIEEALSHIARYGTGHSECIITDNQHTAHSFLKQVDAAAVYHNASTRFTDGGQFGLGAEIGISTQKLHARGPVGLSALTSYKYLLCGKGQIR